MVYRAHERASDSRELMKMYGECRYHAFEPIPKFASVLKRNWNGESRMTIHSYGIGKSDTTFSVSDAVLKGQATFITNDGNDNNTTGGGANVAEIKSFDRVLGQIGSIPTLLHMNCEGCEWEFLVDAKEHGFLDAVPVIQVGWHNYGEVGLGARVWQLCELRQMLSETHTMTNGLAFGWDRWERRKQQ
jgi:FkbM family methyltransferase